MRLFNKQDAQTIVAGFVIGQEAQKQGTEDEMDWSTIEEIATEAGIELTEPRRAMIDKAIDVGYVLQGFIGRR